MKTITFALGLSAIAGTALAGRGDSSRSRGDVAAPAASVRPVAAQASMVLFPAGEIQWKEGPPSMPKGVMTAILEGDPTQAGTFTMRLKFPNGLRVPPHWHTATEHMTVVSGVLHLGMGDKADETSMRTLRAGSFGYWLAGTRHYAWMEGETVLQLHGQGPWTINYVNPADDPRRKTP
jgi:quercetin dioxygenase-like cupin family protein